MYAAKDFGWEGSHLHTHMKTHTHISSHSKRGFYQRTLRIAGQGKRAFMLRTQHEERKEDWMNASTHEGRKRVAVMTSQRFWMVHSAGNRARRRGWSAHCTTLRKLLHRRVCTRSISCLTKKAPVGNTWRNEFPWTDRVAPALVNRQWMLTR